MANMQQRRQLRHRSYSPSPSFHSMSSSSRNSSELGSVSTPRHPVPSMQAAFEESILDLAVDTASSLDRTVSSSPQGSRGRKARHYHSEHHRLLKVVSQIAFGIHLLHARLAKSDPEVVGILQTHVNEMDFFLSVTTNDFDFAKSDIRQRLKHLRVPLGSGRALEVFDQMLKNRDFRLEIVKGNENVEYVISRTAAAMKSALIDVREGLSAVGELAKYLLGLKKGWEDTNLIRVYAAMTLNVKQWFRGLVRLQEKETGLKEDLEQLRRVVGEIGKRARIASRKDRASIILSKKSCPALTANINKPLPIPPTSDSVLAAVGARTAISKRSRSQSAGKRKGPIIIVTEEKRPSEYNTPQRLLSRPRTRPESSPERQQEYEKQRRLSWLRTRPVSKMWLEPPSERSLSTDVPPQGEKGFVSNSDKAGLKRKTSKRKGLKRPESCVFM